MAFRRARRSGLSWGMLVTVAMVAFGCSESPAPKKKVEATPIDPQTVGEISVRASYSGPVPAPKRIVMSSAPQCALAHEGPVFDEPLLVEDGRLKNAIVWIDKGLETYTFAPPDQAVVFDQKGCIYKPRVGVVMVGQPVEFINSDAEPHNVHGFPKIISSWNFMLSRPGSRRTMTFEKPEIGVLVGCDIHPWMRAFLGITTHPYAGVTSGEGTVVLSGVPAGDYTIAAWHEVLGTREQKITVVPHETVDVAFDFAG